MFWRLIAEGVSTDESARRVGVTDTTGLRWFHQGGGMAPLSLVEPVHSRTLTIVEREQILAGISENKSIRAIAAGLGRSPSTVSRELDRNLRCLYGQDYAARNRPTARRRSGWKYSPHRAQLRADRAAARPKPAKLATNERLRDAVQSRLEDNHSPEQIQHRLVQDFPDDPEMRVSHEAIYQSLFVESRGALKRTLTKHLRTGRSLRKPRRRNGVRQPRIKDMVMISERPPEVEDRAVPGNWEGDLMCGELNASAIGTLVERATGFLMLLHLPNDHGALAVQNAMIEQMSRLPESLRRTLTWDQGIEMANHAQIAEATELDIYFCDPHSPWQRGSNENTNGLLRQYFPKGTDLSRWGPGYLERVAAELNNRPRKRLDWATPAETLDRLLSNPTEAVALTG